MDSYVAHWTLGRNVAPTTDRFEEVAQVLRDAMDARFADRKADILRRIHALLRPGGYLILGASEGLTDVGQYYQMVQCNPGIIYRALPPSTNSPT